MKPFFTRWRIKNLYVREFFAEFIGTFILIVVGDAAVAAYKLGPKGSPFDVFSICFAFGVGALIGITASLHVSGAHINPAVTVALATVGKFPLKKIIHYMCGQYLGGFAAAAVVYFTYYEAIDNFDNGARIAINANVSTGGIFATYPSEYISITGVLVDQIVGTALLMFGVVAVTDQRGINTPKCMIPAVFALIITALCTAYGLNCGATLNPARDLSPRTFTAIAGYSGAFDPLDGHFWWVAGLLGPHLGAIIGAWLYFFTIEMHYEDHETNRNINAYDAKDNEEIRPLDVIRVETHDKQINANK